MRIPLAALALVAFLPSVSFAQDACLSGSSALADQRALADLRADTEAACPCASAASRSAYGRCARGVLGAALDANTLRRQCNRAARAIIRGATCGATSVVACGRYDASADEPLSCRPKKPAQCRDTTRFDQTPCPSQSHCADVVDWTATTCTDVREHGPYAPGVRILTLTRPTVLEYCTGGTGNCTSNPFGPGCRCGSDAECQSGVCEIQMRTLETPVWYPAPAGAGPINPSYEAVVDAPLAGGDAPYPLLLFSHGSCGYPLQSLFLTPLLASHGFIVAAPPHPGNTLFEFPTCQSGPALLASAAERPMDMRFVLDELLAADQDSGSPFFTAIDEDRVGMSGHSFGGLTTYLVVLQDSRFKVAVPMAPAVPGVPVVTVPSLTMLGVIDSVVNNDAIRTAYGAAQSPKYKVEIDHAGHYAFSNFCFPSSDCNPPTTLTQDEAHHLVLRYALPFLKVHLAGDASFAPFLDPPGVTGVFFDAQP